MKQDTRHTTPANRPSRRRVAFGGLQLSRDQTRQEPRQEGSPQDSPATEGQVNGFEPPTVFPKWTFTPGKSYRETKGRVVSEFEREFVLWLLTEHKGNVSEAARSAGMDRKHLRDLSKKHNLLGRGRAVRR